MHIHKKNKTSINIIVKSIYLCFAQNLKMKNITGQKYKEYIFKEAGNLTRIILFDFQ